MHARSRRRPFGIVDQILAANDFHERRPGLGLDDDVDVVVGAAGGALQHVARLTAARGMSGTRHRFAEFAVGVLRIFLEGPVGQALLVAQLDPAEVEHGVLHGDLDALPAARPFAL